MPARVPRALKILRGTLRKERDNPDAPQLEPTEVPEPPSTMSDGEKAVWYELKEAVEAIRVYDRAQYTSFRLLVRLVYAADQCPAGASSAGARIWQCAQQALSAWGLRPADRERVHAAPVAPPKSPDDEFTNPESSNEEEETT